MFTRNFDSCWVLIGLIILALSGCDSNSSVGSGNDFSSSIFTLPCAITQSRIFDSGTITATFDDPMIASTFITSNRLLIS